MKPNFEWKSFLHCSRQQQQHSVINRKNYHYRRRVYICHLGRSYKHFRRYSTMMLKLENTLRPRVSSEFRRQSFQRENYSYLHCLMMESLDCLLILVVVRDLVAKKISEYGHQWIGLDISRSMLDIALEREIEGDLILSNMGQGLGIRPGLIDGAISISAVQWLCNADKSCHEPRLRLKAFFGSLYRCLGRGARAIYILKIMANKN